MKGSRGIWRGGDWQLRKRRKRRRRSIRTLFNIKLRRREQQQQQPLLQANEALLETRRRWFRPRPPAGKARLGTRELAIKLPQLKRLNLPPRMTKKTSPFSVDGSRMPKRPTTRAEWYEP
jgi:hypothetical protein